MTFPKTLAELGAWIAADPGLQRIEQAATSCDPAHDQAHSHRVALWTLRLLVGHSPLVPAREAIAAALAHDLVNLPKDAPDRAEASVRSAEAASGLLVAADFSPEAVERITTAIRDHSYSRGAVPISPLGRALQDADRLDALGALGLMRVFSTGAQLGAKFFDPADPWAEARPLDDRAYSIDHFFRKLLRLPERMCTAAGQVEAERRVVLMRRFLEALAEEIGAPRPAAS